VPKKPITSDRQRLREEAEARFARNPPGAKPGDSTAALLHELQVHQIELEMQNDELRRSEIALQEARDQYRKLYDSAYHFAPVGYFTVSDSGLVLDLNLTAAGFLGLERKSIVGCPFPKFIAGVDADRWHKLSRYLRSLGDAGSIDVMILQGEGKSFPAHLDCRVEDGDGGRMVLRVVLTDLRSTALTENDLRESKERIDEFLTESRDGYWEWSRERKLVLSARLKEILSVEGDVPDAPWTDRRTWMRQIHTADVATVTNAMTSLITGHEERCDLVIRWSAPGGTWKPVRVRGHVVKRTDAGEPTWIAGTVTDLSDQADSTETRSSRRARDALAAATIRNFPGGVIALFDEGLRYTLIEGSGDWGQPGRRSLASYVLKGDWGHEEARRIGVVLRAALAGRIGLTEVSVEEGSVEVRAGPVVNPDGSVTTGVATFHGRPSERSTPPGGPAGAGMASPRRRARKARQR
jgi:PAS domain-containing protein